MPAIMWGAYQKGRRNPTYVCASKKEAQEVAYEAELNENLDFASDASDTTASVLKKHGWSFRKVEVSPHKPKKWFYADCY